MTDFCDRFNLFVEKSGVSKKMLAELCGVSRNQIFRYLKGEQTPSTSFFQELKQNFPWVNIEWLITGKGAPDLRNIISSESINGNVEDLLAKARKILDRQDNYSKALSMSIEAHYISYNGNS